MRKQGLEAMFTTLGKHFTLENQHPLMNCSGILHSVIRKARFGSNEEAMFITLQAILTLKNRHSFMKCSGDRRDERLTFCNEEARLGSRP